MCSESAESEYVLSALLMLVLCVLWIWGRCQSQSHLFVSWFLLGKLCMLFGGELGVRCFHYLGVIRLGDGISRSSSLLENWRVLGLLNYILEVVSCPDICGDRGFSYGT
jgi:hypothetical protein